MAVRYLEQFRRVLKLNLPGPVKLRSSLELRSKYLSLNQIHFSTEMAQTSSLELKKVIEIFESWAPPRLGEKWDNVGLLIEPTPPKNVQKILLTNDLSQEVMEEGLDWGVDLILSYHPPIFAPLKRLTHKAWKVSWHLVV